MVNTNDFQQSLHEIQVDYKNSKFLLAVSGGVDSMVLMNLFKGANLNFEVAHINYKLRGEDSDEDQKLVEAFCRQNQIPFHLYQISEKDKKRRKNRPVIKYFDILFIINISFQGLCVTFSAKTFK